MILSQSTWRSKTGLLAGFVGQAGGGMSHVRHALTLVHDLLKQILFLNQSNWRHFWRTRPHSGLS